jgi:Leucine-rich repeat (LRR) protein
MGENCITDSGMDLICLNLINLKKLFLNHNQITDEGLKNIQKLKFMKWLDLRCNKITDVGLKFIGQLTQLSQLSISNNSISD